MKHLLLALLSLFSVALTAQNEPGLLLGGSLNLNYRTAEGSRNIVTLVRSEEPPFEEFEVFTAVPVRENIFRGGANVYLGKIINARTTVGVGLDLSVSTFRQERIDTGSDFTNNNFSVGGYLWARRTLNPANRLRLYLEPRLGYARGNTAIAPIILSTVFAGDNSNALYGQLPFGAIYALNERWLLNARFGSFGITYGWWPADGLREAGSSFDVGFNLHLRNFSLGADYLF